MNASYAPISADALEELRGRLTGRVLTARDPGFDDARTVMLGGIDSRPLAIVRVADSADVAQVVSFARRTDIELAVRSGGHSAAGHSTTDAGIVIDLRDMRKLEIDVEGRTCWAETGLTAGEVTQAAGEHGLAVGFGDTGSVGIGGITLGGGVGYLVRLHGLTIDNLLAAEIVTADGKVRHVDAEHEPDLFWAIRGGGGNFGVATRFRYRLHPLPEFVGGMLVLPATARVVAGFIAAAEAAPEELSAIANVMNCPPMPMVPEEHHGQLVVLAFMAYAGDAQSGERAMAPFRALAEPLADLVQPMPYSGMYQAEEDDSYHPTPVGRTMFLDSVDEAVAATIVDFLDASDASMRAAQLRVLGGAMARVPRDATAFAHRTSRIMAMLVAFYDGPEDRPRRQAWVDEFAAAMQQADRGAYVNFLENEGPERVRAAYPGATWDRLVAIKQRYDPTNLFRLNQNVTPESAAG